MRADYKRWLPIPSSIRHNCRKQRAPVIPRDLLERDDGDDGIDFLSDQVDEFLETKELKPSLNRDSVGLCNTYRFCVFAHSLRMLVGFMYSRKVGLTGRS